MTVSEDEHGEIVDSLLNTVGAKWCANDCGNNDTVRVSYPITLNMLTVKIFTQMRLPYKMIEVI